VDVAVKSLSDDPKLSGGLGVLTVFSSIEINTGGDIVIGRVPLCIAIAIREQRFDEMP